MKPLMSKQPGTPGCGSAAPGQAGSSARSDQRLFTSQRAMSPAPPRLRISAHSVIRGVERPEVSRDHFLIAQTSQTNLLAVDNRHCLEITPRQHFSLCFCAQQAAVAEERSWWEKCFPAPLPCAMETPTCLLQSSP